MKFKIILLFIISCSFQVNAQYNQKIRRTAQVLANAILKENYDTVAKYTYPKVVTAMGGKVKMVVVMKKSLDEMKSKGNGFKDIKVLTYLFPNYNKSLQIPQSGKPVFHDE